MPLVLTSQPFGAITILPPELAEWDPLKTSAQITLTNGNLTAENTGIATWNSTLAHLGHTSGKKYWETSIEVHGGTQTVMVGAQSDAMSLNVDTYVGGSQSSFGWQSHTTPSNSDLWRNNSQINLGFSDYEAGDIVMVALDIDNGDAWFGKNGTWVQGDPATLTSPPVTSLQGGKWYAGFSPLSVGNRATVNFGSTAFTYGIPAGFVAYSA